MFLLFCLDLDIMEKEEDIPELLKAGEFSVFNSLNYYNEMCKKAKEQDKRLISWCMKNKNLNKTTEKQRLTFDI